MWYLEQGVNDVSEGPEAYSDKTIALSHASMNASLNGMELLALDLDGYVAHADASGNAFWVKLTQFQ